MGHPGVVKTTDNDPSSPSSPAASVYKAIVSGNTEGGVMVLIYFPQIPRVVPHHAQFQSCFPTPSLLTFHLHAVLAAAVGHVHTFTQISHHQMGDGEPPVARPRKREGGKTSTNDSKKSTK
ncbi:hypothetical protein HYFRA_00008284 [Hymenoscyphus fraxineus]|uniref:Uncharacterized protein n=1 Tax=Hymenoscyphus fraxineus TaxID=746836 RepID=A0A9N9KR46_9HELO|nr:hypothetical protein HYFRA_00008284 [Hymenoscyphus fraxineus]